MTSSPSISMSTAQGLTFSITPSSEGTTASLRSCGGTQVSLDYGMSAASLSFSESVTILSSSKGAIAFKSVDKSGANVVIENTSTGAEAKSQSLKGWRLQKAVDGSVATDIPLKDIELEPSDIYTVWAKGAKDTATADNEQVADEISFGFGSFTWTILDEAGNEKATLFAEFIGEVLE